ncbi:MAG: hypothetical protein CVV13_11660 [Gammaproteobacteria bacterium HGW-Gammaproteobacteria-3]|nr:MAG: hypothetical protein CVV13_11660 [Gammaproteobacteria bacterium HGW-Gammaproteobacteria-3]
MPLQQLVEYFNDRLEWEHHSNFRPFFLKEGVVHGLFGPIRIGTDLVALRKVSNPSVIAGFSARLGVTTTEIPHLQKHELEQVLSLPARQSINPDSIVDFDRLARTVHMLNFLPFAHEQEFLQLEVDPRHILGVKKDHGAYFQEVILKCGLEPKNIVITLGINSVYAPYYDTLLEGLENYRRRGYRIALKFDYQALDGSAMALVSRLAPDFICFSAAHFETLQDNTLLEKLKGLTALVRKIAAQSIIFQVDGRKTAGIARQTGFDLALGEYYALQEAKSFVAGVRKAG